MPPAPFQLSTDKNENLNVNSAKEKPGRPLLFRTILKLGAGQNNAGSVARERWRPPDDSSRYGVTGTANFNKFRDTVFESNASWVNGHDVGGTFVPPGAFGSVMADSKGMNTWTRTSVGQVPVKTLLDTKPTKEVVMPDLSDITKYLQLGTDFAAHPAEYQKATYADGTANPDYGSPPYVEVWNTTTSSYQRLTNSNGLIAGSAVLVGT